MNFYDSKLQSRYPERLIKLRCGLDRYGFSHMLSSELGYSAPPRFFGNWLHGWIWWDAEAPDDLHFDHEISHKSHVVANLQQEGMLKAEGFTRVFAAGLPFAYVPKSDLRRQNDSLLAMPAHSSEGSDGNRTYETYLDYLVSLKDSFESIHVCLHHNDRSEGILRALRERGLYVINGARADDANALVRMRAIFDSFEYVTTNTLGSHVALSLYSGCKASICGPLHQWSASHLTPRIVENKPHYVARLMHYYSEEYLRRHFGHLLHDYPQHAQANATLGAQYIGAAQALSGVELQRILGWNVKSQVFGYLQTIRSRLA